ncbi:DWNN domain-containing protein [Melampsora americana]|nr:DWNN domain-containing protein [Melampsora americana]
MSGHVYYRFKSQKDFQRIVFDGIGISVWDLKREIITDAKLGKGTDFDFAIYNADTDEEYKNDHAIVPRSSSVIARRLPPKRSGHGNAQQYVNSLPLAAQARPAPQATAHADWRGGGSISKDFRQQADAAAADSEAESMAAMFAAQEEQWQQTQETMATATRVGRVLGFRDRGPARGPYVDRSKPREAVLPDFPPSIPPQGYICYRCGLKGKLIVIGFKIVPTNDDPEFEGRPRIKRTTVESAVVQGKSVMVTADGSFVIARPDDASWKQHKSVVADIQSLRPSDPDLACSICSTLLKSAVKTSCCRSAFCYDLCPECETKLSSNLSKSLIEDEERRTRSREYVEDLLRASKESQEESKNAETDEANKSDDINSTNSEKDEISGLNPSTSDAHHRQNSTSNRTVQSNESGEESTKSSAPTSVTSASANDPIHNSMHQHINGGPIGNGLMGGSMNNGMMNLMNGGNGMPDNMDMSMMHGMGGNHNVVMSSNHPGMFMPNGHLNQNGQANHMNMGGMMNGEEMLPIPMQMNKIMMMLQNPQLQQPMRMQLMMQYQHLQQMFMMQNMGSGPQQMNMQTPNQQTPHMMHMNMMNSNNGHLSNGMTPSHMGGSSGGMGEIDHSGPGPYRGRGGHFPTRSNGGRGARHTNDSAPYQRLPMNGRRPNSNKRGRSEDLIELQSGEKVPRYM